MIIKIFAAFTAIARGVALTRAIEMSKIFSSQRRVK